jgi:hypothetical protein
MYNSTIKEIKNMLFYKKFFDTYLNSLFLIKVLIIYFLSANSYAFNPHAKNWADRNGGIDGWAKCSSASVIFRADILNLNKSADQTRKIFETMDTHDLVMRRVREYLQVSGQHPTVLEKLQQHYFNVWKYSSDEMLVTKTYLQCVKSLQI